MGAKLNGWRIDILACDLSNEVLEKAKVGTYTQFEVQRGLPIQMLVKHFKQNGEFWQISPELRAMCRATTTTPGARPCEYSVYRKAWSAVRAVPRAFPGASSRDGRDE